MRFHREVSTLANFPANAETVYHALIHAARGGHILASGSLGAFYPDTPTTNWPGSGTCMDLRSA